MRVYTDPEQVRLLAEQHREEDRAFFSWLREGAVADEELDATVRSLARAAASAVDCIRCHNCCLKHQPTATMEEVERLANYLGITTEEFFRNYTDDAPLMDALISKCRTDPSRAQGCAFLLEGACIAYEVRPAHCRSYPDLENGGIRESLWDIEAACHICPIVFSVCQELKNVLGKGEGGMRRRG